MELGGFSDAHGGSGGFGEVGGGDGGHTSDEELLKDEGGGADEEGDEFAEDAGFDEDAEGEHEDEPDREEEEPGAEAGVGDAAAEGDGEDHEVAAGGEELRPGLGDEEGFEVPVDARVELGDVVPEGVADKDLPGGPEGGEGEDEDPGLAVEEAGPAEFAVLAVFNGEVDEVERKEEEGGFAVDGGDEKEEDEVAEGLAEVEEVHRAGEEGERGEVVDEAEVLDGVEDVGGGAGDEEEGVDDGGEDRVAGAGLVEAGGEEAGDEQAEDVDDGLDEDFRLDGFGEPEVRVGEGRGEPVEDGALVGPAEGVHHEDAPLERHAFAAGFVEGGVDVGSRDPEVAPGELYGREDVDGDEDLFLFLRHSGRASRA